MENKILEQGNIDNLSKSFNLNELHKLLNVSFNNFKKGKEYKQKNDLDNSFKKFNYSNHILNQLDNICQNNNCNQEIRDKIKKAIKNINNILEKEMNINKKHGGSTLENSTNTIHEVLLPGYSGIEETVNKLSPKENKSSDNENQSLLSNVPIVEEVKHNLENTMTNVPSIGEIKHNLENTMTNFPSIGEIKHNLENTITKLPSNEEQINNKENTNNLFSLINEKYKQRINKYFIQPLNYPELYKKNFNSILLYGYKGNGKSFIVTQSLKKINNKNIIQKYINIKQLVEDDSLLNSAFNELSLLIESKKNEKKIIIIEDLDILNTKDNQEYFYEMIYKYSQQDNIFILATSNRPWELNMNVNNIFEKKILIGFPDIEDINKYFVYKLFQYIGIEYKGNFDQSELETILEEKRRIFNIPILNNIKSINKISKKCIDNKCSYHDLNILINKLFNISAISAIKNNIFQKDKLEKIYFISSSAIFPNNFNEKNTYLLNPPQYNYINYKGIQYKTYNYSSYGISIDDERIKNYYINEKQLSNKKEKEIDIIGEFDIKLSNNTNNGPNLIVSDINKIILNIYIYLFKNIIFNVSNIITNDKTIYKKLNDIITGNINEINKIENLDDFLFLDDNVKNKIINLFPKKEIVNNYNQFKNTYSGCLNTLIQTINLENNNNNYNYNIIYNNKNSNTIEGYEQGIPSDMDNPNKFKDIIISLLTETNNTINGIDFDVQIVYLKTEGNLSWTIEILPDYKSNDRLILQLFQIQIIDSTNKYDISPSIDLPFDSIELDYNYTITNESDVFLLQEKFPQDYQEIYKDETNTWLLKKIKKNEHLEYLQKSYNGYQKFFLNLYHNLLKYKKTCWNYINTKCQKKLDHMLKDIEIRIENILYITQDYDESVEKEIDKWKMSDKHKNYPQDDENEENTNTQNYSVNFMFLKNLLSIMGNFNSIQEIMESYEKSVNGIYVNKNEKIYIKSKLEKKEIDKFYYSNYLNEHKIAENNYDSKYFEILRNKIIKRKSFYFELFINAEEIGILKNNNIQWYNFNSINNDIHIFLKSADFAISNRTSDFVSSLFKNICNQEMYSHMLAYIISSLYITEHNIDNILKLYIGIILYNKHLLINVSNKNLNQNFIELLENNVLDHFSFIKEIFKSIKKEFKNISIPEIPERKKIFNENNTSSIKENELCFNHNLVSENENIQRKKDYSEIVEKKLGYNIKDINNSLKSFNIKIEYLNEIIKVYKCYHNIEVIHLLETFQ